MRSGLKLALVTLPLALVGVGILAFIIARNPPPERNELAERATAVRVASTYRCIWVRPGRQRSARS